MKSGCRFFLLFMALSAPACFCGPSMAAEGAGAEAVDLGRLTILSARGSAYAFQVELARTEKQQLRGLMYRKTLADDGGMLFDYGEERPIAMWMKNTFIPLDMLFIDRTGVIRRIHENAIPHDETPIPSGGAVRAVLELKGGMVARLGIREGDRIKSPIFNAP